MHLLRKSFIISITTKILNRKELGRTHSFFGFP
nr:MAG TPA: hypothetical protein [Bacteriophage sp.]